MCVISANTKDKRSKTRTDSTSGSGEQGGKYLGT